MCREIEMGVAAAQLAILQSGIDLESIDSTRIGTMFGSDYIMTRPAEFSRGVQKCLDENGQFNFEVWGELGRPQVDPLWLLKYLPNMPASHVAIYNDLRGPSNSVTMRESSSNLAIGEALTTIGRDCADVMIAGATGTRIHPLRTVNTAMQEELAAPNSEPGSACRPFDKGRTGVVIGEGAGIVMMEELGFAQSRGATIYGEVLSCSSSTVADVHGVTDPYQAFKNCIEMALRQANMEANEIGHVHAHGMSSPRVDSAEAKAINEVFGKETPVLAAKSHTGNMGAGSGTVEIAASLFAMKNQTMFPVLNFESQGEDAPINLNGSSSEPGRSFINLNITPQGQASAVIVRAFE